MMPVFYHVTSFKDPVEGKVLVGLVKSPGNTWAGWVRQGGPLYLIETREPLPF